MKYSNLILVNRPSPFSYGTVILAANTLSTASLLFLETQARLIAIMLLICAMFLALLSVRAFLSRKAGMEIVIFTLVNVSAAAIACLY